MGIRYSITQIKGWVLKQKRMNFLFFITSISLINCLVLFFVIEILLTPNRRAGYFPDSRMYEIIADNLISGHGFSLSESFPFNPTMYKEPLYPIFIALIKSFFHSSIDLVIFMQMLLSPLIAILLYFIGREIFNEKIARLASFIVVLIPAYADMSYIFSPEAIFTMLLAISLLCLIKAIKSWNWNWFILSGLFLGLSSLARNAALPLFVIYPVVIIFRNKKNLKKMVLLKLVVFVLSFLTITVPWMMRNQQKLGLFSISRRGGEMFSHTAFWAANFTTEEWKAYSLYLLSGNLAKKVYPQIIGKDLGDYEYAFIMRVSYVKELLKKSNGGEGEVEKFLVFEGIKNVLRHPSKYLLLNTIIYVQTFKYFEFITLMPIKDPLFGLSWIMSLIRFLLFIMGIVYSLFALYGIFKSRKLFNNWYILLVTIVYFHIILTITGVIPGGIQRHILPITVFYSFFAVIAIDTEDAYTFS